MLLLESLLALIAHGRRTITKHDGSPVLVPWLNLRVQRTGPAGSLLNRIARVLLCLVFAKAVMGKLTGFARTT